MRHANSAICTEGYLAVLSHRILPEEVLGVGRAGKCTWQRVYLQGQLYPLPQVTDPYLRSPANFLRKQHADAQLGKNAVNSDRWDDRGQTYVGRTVCAATFEDTSIESAVRTAELAIG